MVGAAKLYPPYKKNVFMLNLMAFLRRVGTRKKWQVGAIPCGCPTRSAKECYL